MEERREYRVESHRSSNSESLFVNRLKTNQP